MKKYTVIDLFSGCGGISEGFKETGRFEIVGGVEFDELASKTFKYNFPNSKAIHGDITKIESSEIPDDIDLVIGGFPCQGFSVANTKRSMKDKRNFLYKEMLRIIKDKNPKFFVAENVKGLLSMEKGKVFEMIKKDFESLGYKVDARLLNAAEYGVPQARERLVIIGNRLGIENPFPVPTHWVDSKQYKSKEGLKDPVTVKQTIGFLSNVKLSDTTITLDNGSKIYNHIAATNVYDKFWGRKFEVNQADICDYLRYWRDKSGYSTKKVDEHFGYKYTAGHWFRKDNNSGSIPKPSDWWELKKIFKFDDKYDKQVTTMVEKEIKFEQSLRITNWNRPSDTITATSPEIHINKERRLSARECAMLQTFPMEYQFVGSLNTIYRQIGNAVPVKLAEQIASGIYKSLENSTKKTDNN